MPLVALLLLALAQPAAAQERPSLSGDWVLIDSSAARPIVAATGDAAFPVGNMGSGWGTSLTIRQGADSLIVEYAQFSTYDLQPRQHFAFALDGSEVRNRLVVGHAELQPSARAAWSGATLVITTLYPTPPEVGASPTEVRQTLSLDGAGRLVIETTRPGARAPDVVRTTYRRR